MRCYACGAELTDQDFCTACGADVAYYKKIRFLSNRLYNEALDKARVRDLSGAVRCLRQSIRLYRGNIDARNLLGLVYYETGEVVAALTEWVISKNFREEKNLAGHLLDEVQNERQRLETLGRTAKKYNLALSYARQGSYDLAVIQLKRILQLNPGYLRARQLLALLYLRAGEFERAKLECGRCLRIDSGDTMAKRYLKEAQTALLPTDQKRAGKRDGDVIRYQSGNETIIQPPRVWAGGGVLSAGMLAAGIAAGVAIAWFLILPSRVSRVQQAFRQEVAAVSEESDAKSIQIRNLEQELSALRGELEEMTAIAQAPADEEEHQDADMLMRAVDAYLVDREDIAGIKGYMEQVNPRSFDGQEGDDIHALALYMDFKALVGTELAEAFYQEGYAAYRSEDDASAIAALEKAYELDETKEDALFWLGRAYYRSGDTENARSVFEEVISSFPGTTRASEAQDLIAEINNAGT